MEGTSLKSTEEAGKSMQESWVDVQQGRVRGEGEGEGEGVERHEEGSLVHSRSQQEMEQLLASAASDDEASETDVVSSPRFAIPEQPAETPVQKGSRVAGRGQREVTSEGQRSSSHLRALSLRGSWLFSGNVLHLLFPVLILTHLALFGLGFYIGRRTTLVKAM